MFNACYHFIYVNWEQCNENTKKKESIGSLLYPGLLQGSSLEIHLRL